MKTTALFNGAVETGMRTAMVLATAFPDKLDLSRLVILDYIMVHSGDIPEGPPSLHPATPLRAGEIAIRRGLLENGLHLLAMKGLIDRHLDASGITYSARPEITTFLDALSTEYALSARSRAEWTVRQLDGLTTPQIRQLIGASMGQWKTEFVTESKQEVQHD